MLLAPDKWKARQQTWPFGVKVAHKDAAPIDEGIISRGQLDTASLNSAPPMFHQGMYVYVYAEDR